MAELAPIEPPVGLFPGFCVPRPVTLIVKEEISLGGDDFGIEDSEGNVVCRCDAKHLSLSARKTITDSNGNVLFHLKRKIPSLHMRFVAEGPNEEPLFEVTKHIGIHAKMKLTFVNRSTCQETIIHLAGGWFARNAELTLVDEEGPKVGRIEKKLGMRALAGQQTYHVSCAPGVDLALMAAFAICFDEACHDQKRGGAGSQLSIGGPENSFLG